MTSVDMAASSNGMKSVSLFTSMKMRFARNDTPVSRNAIAPTGPVPRRSNSRPRTNAKTGPDWSGQTMDTMST